jgi:hypothetical protein
MIVYMFTEPYIIDTFLEINCPGHCLRRDIGTNFIEWSPILIFSKERFEWKKKKATQ